MMVYGDAMSDTAPVQLVQKLLPGKDQEPWLVSDRCRVFFDPNYSYGAVFLIKDYFKPGGPARSDKLYGEDVITVFLPSDLSQEVRKGKELFRNRVEAMTNSDGSTALYLDVYRQYLDTGSYFTRDKVEVHLNANGQLNGFRAESFVASRLFVIFGPYGEFKTQKLLECGRL